jgi:hypothetical protein
MPGLPPGMTLWGWRTIRRAMTLKEKMLFHQIHPVKLATDALALCASLYFLWQQQFLIGLALLFVPPLLASFLLVKFATLDRYRDSAFGRYLVRHMTRFIEGVRLFGALVMALGAWAHDVKLIVLGLFVVIGAWCNGLMTPKRAR